MRILITGGAGFIGSHISRLLLDQGHEVVIYDNFSHSTQDNVDRRAKIIKGDIKDQQLLADSLKGCEAVIHMAALIEVNESVKNPLEFGENNIQGSITLLEAMRETGVKKIILSSSCCVYGNPTELPLTEETPVLAANPYGATKVAVENMIRSYHLIHGFDATILRYFNPYGPGENHQPETHAIPNIIKSALNHTPIPLYWQGQQIRDFIYVEDLAQAHIKVLELSGWNIFNVGTEQGVKVIDVINKLSDILGYSPETEDKGERAGDVPALYASSKLIQQATGWKAEIGLEEGLRRTVEWFKKQ